MVIGTDCIGSCEYNYHTITATTAPLENTEGQSKMDNPEKLDMNFLLQTTEGKDEPNIDIYAEIVNRHHNTED